MNNLEKELEFAKNLAKEAEEIAAASGKETIAEAVPAAHGEEAPVAEGATKE